MKMFIRLLIGFAFIGLFSFLPLELVIISSLVGHATGCAVDEASAHTCMLWGHDIGPTLSDMFVSGWFILLTVPIGAMVAFFWLIVNLLVWAIWKI